MDKQKPKFDKEYCDNNDIRAKWFPFDDELQTLLLLLVEEDVVPEGNKEAGEFLLDGGYMLGLTMYAIMQYKEFGYIKSTRLEQWLMNRKDYRTARAAYKHAVELIEKSRIQYAEKVWNGAHAHDKYKNDP